VRSKGKAHVYHVKKKGEIKQGEKETWKTREKRRPIALTILISYVCKDQGERNRKTELPSKGQMAARGIAIPAKKKGESLWRVGL